MYKHIISITIIHNKNATIIIIVIRVGGGRGCGERRADDSHRAGPHGRRTANFQTKNP